MFDEFEEAENIEDALPPDNNEENVIVSKNDESKPPIIWKKHHNRNNNKKDKITIPSIPPKEDKKEEEEDIIIMTRPEFTIVKDIYIISKFDNNIIDIGYVFLANGEQNVVKCSNGRINMLHGRMYFIPIDDENKSINSDSFNIKIHRDAADRFDVRYVVDGLAAVVPIRHNAILKTGEKLCILTPLY
jgi:hypothetical protein